jgi:hypothetical protein
MVTLPALLPPSPDAGYSKTAVFVPHRPLIQSTGNPFEPAISRSGFEIIFVDAITVPVGAKANTTNVATKKTANPNRAVPKIARDNDIFFIINFDNN